MESQLQSSQFGKHRTAGRISSGMGIKILEGWTNSSLVLDLHALSVIQGFKLHALTERLGEELVPLCRYEYTPNYFQNLPDDNFWHRVKKISESKLVDALLCYEETSDDSDPVSYTYEALCSDYGRNAKCLTFDIIETHIASRLSKIRAQIERWQMSSFEWKFKSLGVELSDILSIYEGSSCMDLTGLSAWHGLMFFDPFGEFRFEVKIGKHQFAMYFPYRFIRESIDAVSLVPKKVVPIDYWPSSKLCLSDDDAKRYPLPEILRGLGCSNKKIRIIDNLPSF